MIKKQYKTLIVDDERLARKDIIQLLAAYDFIEVAGEAEDVPSAIRAIRQLNPDLIVLDIQMPGESGFDLLEKIKIDAKIIFVTAYDEYAIQAFDVNALDYLLKPVHPDRLTQSLQRLQSNGNGESHSMRKLEFNDRLFLSVNNHLRFLKVNKILCINSAGDYSEIVTVDGINGLTQKSLKEWENRLPSNYFCRIHRSSIINMEYIDNLEEWFNYSFRVYLKGVEKPFTISRRYAAILKNRLG